MLNTAAPVMAPGAEPGAPTTASPRQDARGPLGGDALPIALPPLDESDAPIRARVSALSPHPPVAAWLATEGLARNFTVVVANIAEGEGPAVHLTRLRPSSRFQVIERNGEMVIDPRSYERYTPVASAVAAINPADAARLYSTLKPLLEEAHRELGYGGTSFDVTLERAIVRLLETPVPRDPVPVVPHGIGYAFEERRLEKLSPAQKHLLRFGPRNAQTVQHALRNIAVALGIPEERLPD
jgi:hypothetical protein